MQSIIDNDTKISHEKLSGMIENRLMDEKERQKLKLSSDIVLDLADWAYTPIVQSGGKYDLKPSAVSNTDRLHDGTIICSLGVRYRSYCSNIARTFLVNPEKVRFCARAHIPDKGSQLHLSHRTPRICPLHSQTQHALQRSLRQSRCFYRQEKTRPQGPFLEELWLWHGTRVS